MKPIAIHNRLEGYNKRWVEYCKKNSIPYKIVDCFDSNIVQTLRECYGLMWHWNYDDYKDRLFALKLISTLQLQNIKVYPDFNTCWHFDDKIAQKYLLESVGAPIPTTYIFYSKDEALKWSKESDYPLVFKLKAGAGSQNVRLVQNHYQAKRLIKKSFGKGFKHINQFNIFKDKFLFFLRKPTFQTFKRLVKNFYRIFFPTTHVKMIPREKGYAYFQEFLPNNNFDTRLVVIGNRCFGLRRYNRKNDFRASGSGYIEYNKDFFSPKLIKLAFDITKKIKAQIIAFDFVQDKTGSPVILEISYGISIKSYDDCLGYWDTELKFHPGKNSLSDYMIKDFIDSINTN